MLKFIFLLTLGLVGTNTWADATILGFEDSLNYEDKARLESFMAVHKRNGYTKCYYQTSEDTVVCENSDHEKVYFK